MHIRTYVTLALCAFTFSTALPLERRVEPGAEASPQFLQTHFKMPLAAAGASYCNPLHVINHKCGSHCTTLGNQVDYKYAVEGVSGVPAIYMFIRQSIVYIAHEGTASGKDGVTDIDARQDILSAKLFPLSGKNAQFKVHNGFAKLHKDHYAALILEGLKTICSQHACHHIIIAGHSLGGAQTLLTFLMLTELKGSLPFLKNVKLEARAIAAPRLGNEALVKHVKTLIDSEDKNAYLLLTLHGDMVPKSGPQMLDYHHIPDGELHIGEDGKTIRQPGVDNPKGAASTSLSLLHPGQHIEAHKGPYLKDVLGGGVILGKDGCAAEGSVQVSAPEKQRAEKILADTKRMKEHAQSVSEWKHT